MLPTAEAADIMRKPIHEEIIILQNYFKSMRAKMDGAGRCWGQAAITQGVFHGPAISKGLDSLVRKGRESPSFLCQGLGKPGMSNTKGKENTAQQSMALELMGDCQCGF